MMRNKTIDLAKFVAALMIVAIHTSLFSDCNDTLSFVTLQILCRVAVPFFAVCSGFFLSAGAVRDKTLKKTRENQQRFLSQWKKLLWLYAVWTAVYLLHSIPMWIETGWISPFAFVDYAIGALTKGSHYHLWYLWGMIYTLPIFYGILRTVPGKWYLPLAAALWIVKAVSYAYAGWLPPQFETAVRLLQYGDALLCLLPLLLLGAYIAGRKAGNKGWMVTGFCFSAVGLVTEVFFLREAGQTAVSYVFCTLPVAYFLFCIMLQIQVPFSAAVCEKLRRHSLFLYCVHPIFTESIGKHISNSVLRFAAVTLLSLLLSVICRQLNQIIRKKDKLCST